ncbi:hypothetical protein ABL78_0315 [Leptomonas seymouri]|uniref:Paraflagellar rod component n=1 Tax=Leptomonas seymouri TaxID=5684 RepID=A0A0N1IMS3_LEPSE|nr:hypothetical protein ABL78_0315 [Leptomonas seymouri]|eukprot:KPI90555.1 hypothetical protein ABL78_0315 [Leptomonas seymouri]
MDKVNSSIAPLSPFTWHTDEESEVQPAAFANAVLNDISLLDLRFDLIVDEFAVPCRHPLRRINGGFPLRWGNLTPRQLQLLQYGVVVHKGERLVIVAVPPCCGDSGECLAASYEHLFSRPLDVASAVANHPFLPEYTFVVYRLPEDVGNQEEGEGTQQQQQQQHPQSLFRLVYRNVNPHSNATAGSTAEFNVAAEPQYKLVAVLVSSTTYYGELQRVSQYRREWFVHNRERRASRIAVSQVPDDELLDLPASYLLPEAVAADVRSSSSLSKLCTFFALVLERISQVEEDATAAVSAGPGSGQEAPNASGEPCKESTTTNVNDTVAPGEDPRRPGTPNMTTGGPWSYQYTCEGARLINRLSVVECTKAVLQSWRDGELNLTEKVVSRTQLSNTKKVAMAEHSTHPPLSVRMQSVPCARLLLLPAHRPVSTQISGNEIVSFLPNDGPPSLSSSNATAKDSFRAVVYANPAAERLRRWILQGLIAAEVHGIHAVFLDLDPITALLPCVELLARTEVSAAGNEEEETEADAAAEDETSTATMRYRRALLLVCQIAVETVEQFVRHSGLVWKVTVGLRETSASAGSITTSTPPLGETPFTPWCKDMLELIREAETQREKAALYNSLNFFEEDGGAAEGAALVVASGENALVSGGGPPSLGHLSASQQLALRMQEVVDRAVTLYSHETAGRAAPLPPHIVRKAREVGVKVSDVDLYALFQIFCVAAKRRDTLLPASALVDVLTEEWLLPAGKRHLYTAASARLVCPLDSCGVPVTRARVKRFLQPFLDVMRDSPFEQNCRAVGALQGGAPQLLNYAQFSMVMFAIARM